MTRPKETTVSPPATPPLRTRNQLVTDARALDTLVTTAAAAVDVQPPSPSSDVNETVGEVWLYGVVGGWWRGFDAESVARAIRDMDVDVLHVRIHSPGGVASEGTAIANLFRNHKARVVVAVDGLAASAASVIALAGDQIIMCPGSQMMIHDVSTGIYGNEADLRVVADWVGGQSDNYAGVYAYKAGGTAQQWRDLMKANDGLGTWYIAEAAVTAKLADEVGTLTAIGSPPIAPEDDWEQADEEMLARAAHDLQILDTCVHPAARALWRGERPKPPTASADGTPKKEGPTLVDFTPENIAALRQQVGFAEDADADTITAAIAEALDERAGDDPPADATTGTGLPVAILAQLGLPATADEGTVVAAFAQLHQNATAGAAAAEQLRVTDREAFLDAHRDRFVPAARASWQQAYDQDAENARTALEAAAVIVPLDEVGHDVPQADGQQDDGWFPQFSTPTAKEA